MPAVTPTSACRWIALDEESRHTWAVALELKLARLTFTSALEATLLIAITVSAPSDVRSAANTDRLSGFGPLALTLTSPNVDLAPS